MVILTIPKKLAKKDDLVVIPRREYEALVELKKIREFTPTLTQKKALARAERDLKQGKTLSYNELVSKLGLGN
jgi:PHD/YefM family antitoxin component YafN of YafNO toxin-antitoxin module